MCTLSELCDPTPCCNGDEMEAEYLKLGWSSFYHGISSRRGEIKLYWI